MPEPIPVERDNDYEDMVRSYQLIEVARLNELLKKHSVPAEARREICEEYFFDSSVFFDFGWLKVSGRQVSPSLCFAEKPLDANAEGYFGEMTKLYVQMTYHSFHESVVQNVINRFYDEDGESIQSLEYGNI